MFTAYLRVLGLIPKGIPVLQHGSVVISSPKENSGLNLSFTPCFGPGSWLGLEFGCWQPLRKRDVERGATGWIGGRAAMWELGTGGIIGHLSCPALAQAGQWWITVPAGI